MSAFGAPRDSNNPDGMEPGTKHKRIRCPKCGERFGNLPQHLEVCAG